MKIWDWDWKLQQLINATWVSNSMDHFFSYVTNIHKQPLFAYFLIPLLFIFWVWKGRKRAVLIILSTMVLAGVSDLVAYRVLKEGWARPRPNHFQQKEEVRVMGYGPKSYGFPSAHAMTTAAMGTYLSYFYPALAPIFAAWSILIAYSRVYTGVHFPSDVLGGLFFGLILGGLWIFLAGRFIYYRWRKPIGSKSRF